MPGVFENVVGFRFKIMSISDDLMWSYYELLSFRPLEEVAELKAGVDAGKNPRDVKVLLAIFIY